MEHKSERMMQTALANGWKAQIKVEIPENGQANEIVWVLYAIRDKESLRVWWTGELQTGAVYAYGDYRKYPHRKAGVLKLITGTPNPGKLQKIDVEEIRSISFNMDSPAIEILLEVLGKTVTWVRGFDGEILNGFVEKETNLGKPYFRVYSASSGRRILEWQDREGFHAVGLDQIISVG